MLNKVILRGRLVKDSILEFAKGKGTAICKFTLANNITKEKAIFINCVGFNKLAEIMGEHLKKGQEIIIEGQLNQNTYEGVTYTNIIVNQFEFIGSGKKVEKQLDVTPVDDVDRPF